MSRSKSLQQISFMVVLKKTLYLRLSITLFTTITSATKNHFQWLKNTYVKTFHSIKQHVVESLQKENTIMDIQ